jgi:transposase-like protein
MGRPTKYPPEVRERAVRLVLEQQREHESQWAAIESIAAKMGCTAETLRKWVRQAERDHGQRAGLTTAERKRLAELERVGSSGAEATDNLCRGREMVTVE